MSGKYPPELLTAKWYHDWALQLDPKAVGIDASQYIARMACDWLQEQLTTADQYIVSHEDLNTIVTRAMVGIDTPRSDEAIDRIALMLAPRNLELITALVIDDPAP